MKQHIYTQTASETIQMDYSMSNIDLGDREQAFAVIGPPRDDQENNDFVQMVNTSSLYNFKRQLGTGRRRLPDALIIGVKKCGTRALIEYLRLHPDIRAPVPEIHFFDTEYAKGFDWYRNQMPTTVAGQMTIEKTALYYVIEEGPQRVHLMNPGIKLV